MVNIPPNSDEIENWLYPARAVARMFEQQQAAMKQIMLPGLAAQAASTFQAASKINYELLAQMATNIASSQITTNLDELSQSAAASVASAFSSSQNVVGPSDWLELAPSSDLESTLSSMVYRAARASEEDIEREADLLQADLAKQSNVDQWDSVAKNRAFWLSVVLPVMAHTLLVSGASASGHDLSDLDKAVLYIIIEMIRFQVKAKDQT